MQPARAAGAGRPVKRLIVHLPLFESLPGGAERLPRHMRRLLERARRFECAEPTALAELLQVPPLPAPAVLSRLARTDAAPRAADWWLRFDPVRLIPDLTAVWLDRAVPLDFGSEALRPVVAELQQMFRAEGLAWRPGSGEHFGLLALDKAPAVSFAALDDVHGKRLDDVLPEGPDAARWRKLINESQMVFHQFRPLSRADQQGVGLWFWGAGEIAEPVRPAHPMRIVDGAGSARVQGLANWLGAHLADSHASFGEFDEAVCHVHWPLQSVDIDRALSGLDERWLAPAWRALRRGRLGETVIVGSTGYWRTGPMDAIRFWRRGIEGFGSHGGKD